VNVGAPSATGTSDASGSSCTASARPGRASGAWFALACWLALAGYRCRRNAEAFPSPRPGE
jgi:hypothetical protein